MSFTSKSESQQQAERIHAELIHLEAEINDLKGERKVLQAEIRDLKDKPKAERSEEDRKDLTANISLLSALETRLAGLESDRRVLRAQASSAATTAQQGM